MVTSPKTHDYGFALRVLRAARDVDQRTVADAARVDYSYISLIESGQRRNPSLSLRKKLAGYFGISLSVFEAMAERYTYESTFLLQRSHIHLAFLWIDLARQSTKQKTKTKGTRRG